MEATIVSDNIKHYPVLLKEIISIIDPQHGGTFIDCTLGQGGYTKEILKYKNTKVIGLDRDINSEIIGKKIQEKFKKSAFIGVTGCSLYKTDGEEIDEAEAMRSTVAAIKFLVNVKGADTIYWFSDLNDPQDEAALEELRFFFYKNLVTFYISSVGHKPSKELKNIIHESG